MASNNEEKKGFGPALAALILGIVAFVITGAVALVFNSSSMKSLMEETLQQSIAEALGSGVATTPDEIAFLDAFAVGMKAVFGAVFFSGGLFMLISFICGIVAVCKYGMNKAENKAVSTLVIALIGLGLLLASIIIAIMGVNAYSAIIDKIMLPYYG